jgi:hypothetical protein
MEYSLSKKLRIALLVKQSLAVCYTEMFFEGCSWHPSIGHSLC